MAHTWTMEEEEICCISCINEYVKKNNGRNVSEFIEALCLLLKDIPYGSMDMKIKNIKQLFNELNVKNSLNIGTLTNYSRKNEKAMISALERLGVPYSRK